MQGRIQSFSTLHRVFWATAATLCAAALLSGCSSNNVSASMQGPPPAQVKVMPAELQTVQDTSEYVATIKSRNSATIQP